MDLFDNVYSTTPVGGAVSLTPTGSVVKYDAKTQTTSTVVSWLQYPTTLAVDGAGHVFISRALGGPVLEYLPANQTLRTLSITAGAGLTVDSYSNVYVGYNRESPSTGIRVLPTQSYQFFQRQKSSVHPKFLGGRAFRQGMWGIECELPSCAADPV